MIIDRITALRLVPPKVTQVPVRSVAHDSVAIYRVGAYERQITEGTTGAILDVSYEELEIDVYSPRDVVAYAQHVRI